MGRLAFLNWLRAPVARDVIARWTVEDGTGHTLILPSPPDPERFEFLAVGDTGDSEGSGAALSAEDAVGRELAADALLPGGTGQGRLLLHVGDVVYMAGERRLYDRNFRRPFAAFLTPESTVDRLVFRFPFLPVPGNHDYYDLAGWAGALASAPLLGAGIRAVSQQLFAYDMPRGGSDMGRAYMEAFVERDGGARREPLAYRPGVETRVPNRYYRFRAGQVDFFALDSNTLQAPRPDGAARARADAGRRIEALEARAEVLDRQLRRDQLALERWRRASRRHVCRDPVRRAELVALAALVGSSLEALGEALASLPPALPDRAAALGDTNRALHRWAAAAAALEQAQDVTAGARALRRLERAATDCCAALHTVENCLGLLPEGPDRARLLEARNEVDRHLERWREASETLPGRLCARLRQLSEAALDVQRELARERVRRHFRGEDHDDAQLAWLAESLEEAARERPDGWRVVYLHHPLYTTITNHCERADVQSVRENLLELLRERAHLVLTGHSHAFEWLRSEALPHAGIFVTGGGGQTDLRRSVLDPRRYDRYARYYEALRSAGIVECAVSGRGPADGRHTGPIYHYLRVEVTPEALLVRPVGVRRTLSGYRREEPMPAYHAPRLPEGQPPWYSRRLEAVEIRRDRPPRAVWAG